MPMMSRECLALKFRQNWLAKHPVDGANNGMPLDDSLTSLNWLQNLNIMKITTPTPPASPTPPLSVSDLPSPPLSNSSTCNISGELRVNPNAVLNMTNLPNNGKPLRGPEPSIQLSTRPLGPSSFGTLDIHPPHTMSPAALDKVDYKSNPLVKPPYSYATLICMAMKESKKNKITLAGIYNWITENFMYYRLADPSWQNSIRHNLSLNKCFQKVPRRKDEPGKGGFWRINPEHSDMFVNGIFKKRRNSARENIAPPLKRFRRDPEDCLISGNRTYDNCVKVEPVEEAVYNLERTMAAEDAHQFLTGDFNWNAILHQDIDVGGVRIKTEDILDSDLISEHVASPIIAMSPPSSDTNSDVGLDELLNGDLDSPLDLSKGIPLDLTVQGTCIKPPEWWSESMTRSLLLPIDNNNNSSGLNTPIPQSPVSDSDFSHPWAEQKSDIEEAMAAFDLDLQNLFEDDSISSYSDS